MHGCVAEGDNQQLQTLPWAKERPASPSGMGAWRWLLMLGLPCLHRASRGWSAFTALAGCAWGHCLRRRGPRTACVLILMVTLHLPDRWVLQTLDLPHPAIPMVLEAAVRGTAFCVLFRFIEDMAGSGIAISVVVRVLVPCTCYNR